MPCEKGETMRRLYIRIGMALLFAMPLHVVDGFPEPPDYEDYAATLAAYVDENGMVDYSGLKRDRARLDTFARSLADIPETDYQSWETNDRLAFWINAYNALTLVTIINNYPIKSSRLKSLRFQKNSIGQIDGVWNDLKFTILNDKMTLDHIAHEVIRKDFNEPRIHMALVCATVSSPPLRIEPFMGAKLDRQLDDQTRLFLSHPRKFGIDRDKDRVHLSEIFEWYSDDFLDTHSPAGGYGDHSDAEKAVLAFIAPYLGPAEESYLRRGDYSISYLEYDWTLNER